jgi:hypothetical protein
MKTKIIAVMIMVFIWSVGSTWGLFTHLNLNYHVDPNLVWALYTFNVTSFTLGYFICNLLMKNKEK